MAFKINAPFHLEKNHHSGRDNRTEESNKKPGGKATGSMKDYKIGSAERYNEYEARGWKQDDTTKGGEPRKKAKTVASNSKGADIKVEAEKPKVSLAKPTKKVEPTKKQARKTKSINKKLDKAKAARDAGNIKKAERKERAAKRKAARVARKSNK